MKEGKKKITLTVIGILLIACVLLGISYALWTITHTQESTNTISTDCFKINFTDKNPISLSKAFPMINKDGMQLEPYTFTIENVCDSSVKYQINLETLEQASGTKVLPDKYVKANLSEETSNKITTKLDKESNPNLNTDTTIKNAIEAYKLYTGIMGPNETKTFNVRLWMDEGVTIENQDAMGASFEGKVTIIASYFQDNRGTLMAVNMGLEMTTGAFWDYQRAILKVVFEDKLQPKETSEDLIFDVSEAQDKSVMSYLVANDSTSVSEEEKQIRLEAYIQEQFGMTLEEYRQMLIKNDVPEDYINIYLKQIEYGLCNSYTLYIQSDGGIKANQNSMYLFAGFTKLETIENLELFDTSSITDMESMFDGCVSLTSLDLSSFDTSNVTNMRNIFSGCSSLTSLDLSSFDTSNVTNMRNIFSGCSSLTSLDLSSFDTSNVTNMGGMFKDCSNLTSLDLSNFDTSNVTNMDIMFYNCSSLIRLDLSNFDTSKVTNMDIMFRGCSDLMSLNVSNFDTKNVTSMLNMFYDCSNLITISYGENFVHKDSAQTSFMFHNCPANKPTGSSWNGVIFE